MTEYEQELVKEVLIETRKAKEVIDRSFERLEALASRLIEKKDVVSGVIPPDDMPEPEG